MASGGPPDPKDKRKWEFEAYKLLGIEKGDRATISQTDVRKAFLSRIFKSHPDKTKGDEEKLELTKKLNAAYAYLYEKHSEKLKDTSESFTEYPESKTEDKSRMLEEEKKSEHYKRVFQSHVNVAKEIQFMDNFQTFYQQCFDHVTPQPEEETGYHCEICDEDFIFAEDHFELVTSPYTEYVLNGVELEFWEYMESLFGEEMVNGLLPNNEIDNWTCHTLAAVLPSWCEKIESLKTGDWVENLKKLEETEDPSVISFLYALFQAKEKGVSDDEICALAVQQIPIHSELDKISDVELVLPAFLKVTSEHLCWSKWSLQVSSTSPRLALVLACSALQLDKDEDFFLQLGEHLIKCENNWKYAHLCFSLGSCDLKLVADRVLLLSGHIDCKRLAAYYFLKTKELAILVNKGRIAASNKDIDTAAVFLFPVVWHFYEIGDIDNVVVSLAHLLSGQRYWKAVQSIALDMPLEILNSVQVARVTLEKILEDLANDREVVQVAQLRNITFTSFYPVENLQALCGALHIIDQDIDNDEQIVALKNQIVKEIKSNLTVRLQAGDAGFIMALTRFPGIKPLIKQYLEFGRFLGPDAVKLLRPVYPDCAIFLILRAIYHYKNRQFTEMSHDLVLASCYERNTTITKEIAVFLAANPMITEKILKTASRQFEQLQDCIEDYSGEPVDSAKSLEVLQKTTVENEMELSSIRRITSKGNNGQDVGDLEDELYDDDDPSNGDGIDDVATCAERAYNYTNLEVICHTRTELLCCWIMAAQYFFRAMKALPDEKIVQKWGYRGVLLEICKQIQFFVNLRLLSPPAVIFASRTSLAFVFRANEHFSGVLRRQNINGTTPFIKESEISEHTKNWQELLNLRTVCPLIVPDIFTISEGRLALCCFQNLNKSLMVEKIESGLFSKNTRDYLHHHLLFNGVWGQEVLPEDTRYEIPIRDVSQLHFEVIRKEDQPEEIERKKLINDASQKEMEEIEEMRRKLKDASLVDRMGFQVSRANSMLYLADLYGYDIAEVEMMMNWKMIRRTEDGFIDIQNRTLNFDGEEGNVYSRFLGVQLNPHTKSIHFLLEPAIAGDPNKPALFSGMDLMEIFGNKIIASFLSFDEELQSPDGIVPEHLRMILPSHPFFKVRFGGYGPSGNDGKERICGTNFQMTQNHVDLTLKIFATGQEVGANFPFPLRDTKTGLLSNLSKENQNILKPIGPRKNARSLKNLEIVDRVWVTVHEVEQEIINNVEQFGGSLMVLYGNATATLNTMPMMRDESGKLVDAKDKFDENSPEAKFVQGFNQNWHLIEKDFPIFQRNNELAKISACVGFLQQNKHVLEEDIPSLGSLLNLQMPQTRPYSRCGETNKKCDCCDWVPAVYHEMKVTDEQKLEYLFGKGYGQSAQNAVSDKEKLKLEFNNSQTIPPVEGSDSTGEASGNTGKENESKADDNDESKADDNDESKADDNDESKADDNDESKADDNNESKADDNDENKADDNDESKADDNDETKKPWMDLSGYDLLQQYRCYGGVLFQPLAVPTVAKISPPPQQFFISWEKALNVAFFAAQFISTFNPAATMGRIESFTSNIPQGCSRDIEGGSGARSGDEGGAGGGGEGSGGEGSGGEGSGGEGSGGEGSEAKGKRRRTKRKQKINTTNRRHKNYVGTTWLYYIRPENGKMTDMGKIGITSTPPNSKGNFPRVQAQLRELHKNNPGQKWKGEIAKRHVYATREAALKTEAKLYRYKYAKGKEAGKSKDEYFGLDAKKDYPDYEKQSKGNK